MNKERESRITDSEGGRGDDNSGGQGRGMRRRGWEKGGGSNKKEEMAKLEKELEQEIRYRDTILWSVGVLQQSVDELQKQLDDLNSGEDEDSEFKLRYEAQLELNSKLEEQTLWYEEEVEKTKEKIKKGQEFSYDADLDKYTEFELLRMVKSLERERNNLYSDLRNKSWLLDNQSKEYHHLKELIRAYTGDLTIVNRSLEHMWRQRSISRDSGFAGGATPVTSPGGVKWSSGQSGIRPSQRILDPRKGPIRKTVGVRSLPRLDQEALDYYDAAGLSRKARSRSRGRARTRAKSLEAKKESDRLMREDERAKSSGEVVSQRSSSGVFEESSYEASNEASTSASVELGSEK